MQLGGRYVHSLASLHSPYDRRLVPFLASRPREQWIRWEHAIPLMTGSVSFLSLWQTSEQTTYKRKDLVWPHDFKRFGLWSCGLTAVGLCWDRPSKHSKAARPTAAGKHTEAEETPRERYSRPSSTLGDCDGWDCPLERTWSHPGGRFLSSLRVTSYHGLGAWAGWRLQLNADSHFPAS